jgi:ribosomal protein S6
MLFELSCFLLIKKECLGTKLFSYPVKGFSSGTYIQMTFTGNGELVQEITKQLAITESVIRHITIKKEDK